MTYDDMSVGELLDAIASERVAPAGGTATAVTGATGAALCEMVCIHTETAADTEATDDGADRESLPALRARLQRRRRTLLALGEQDAALVEKVFGDGEVPSTRLQRRAAGIPLAVSETALGVVTDAETVHRRGRDGVAADARTGAYLADAAVRASLETLRINVVALPDRSFAADLEDRAADIERSAAAVRGRLFGADE